jgi:hypothetical protein
LETKTKGIENCPAGAILVAGVNLTENCKVTTQSE